MKERGRKKVIEISSYFWGKGDDEERNMSQTGQDTTCFSAETKPFLAVLSTAILQKPTRAAGEEKSLQTPVPHKLDLGAMEVS